jgi:hypothetical protein
MLLSYFFPTYWKNKLLFAKNILSVGIRDGFFIACLSNVSRSKTTVLNVQSIPLPEENPAQAPFEAQAECIKKTLESMKKYDELIVTESCESIVFKELEFPFATREQLNLVLSEELEPQLPFNPNEAYTGFVVNEVRPDGTSTSLTATLKKIDFDAKFAPFLLSKTSPDLVAIDTEGIAFCINKMYPATTEKDIPLRIVLDVKKTYTQLIFMLNGVIKAVKNLPLGLTFIYPEETEKKEPSPEPLPEGEEAQETLQENAPAPLLNEENVRVFIEKILFTCDALAFKFCDAATPQIIFFLSPPCDAALLQKHIEAKNNRSVEFFSTEIAQQCPTIVRAKNCPEIDWPTMCALIGTAGLQQSENHIQLPVEITQERLFSAIQKNILIACLIFAGIVGTVAAVGYKQLSTLGRVLTIAENTQLSKLKEKFPSQLADQRKLTLKRAISEIEDYVKEQQVCWNMLGAKSLDPLEVLYELTELIDRRLFNVDISHVTLSLSDDDHTPQVVVGGTFMSKTDAHYSDFGLLEKHLAMSKRLVLTKDIESSFDDNAHGVKFTAHLKLRDQ